MGGSVWAWMNGEIVPREDAMVHVGSTALHFGPTVFEGIRCYAFEDGRNNIFRLTEHVERLHASAFPFHLEIPFSVEEIERACSETVIANGHTDAYLRILAFPGSRTLGFGRPSGPAETCILSFPWQHTHLERSQERGIRIHISSVIRTEAHPVLSKSKVSANYAAGLLAINEAHEVGCDDALLLDRSGAVCEASTANVFAVWDNQLITPPLDLPILAGITRDTLLVLARDMGIDVREEKFDVEQLALADEIFISGTTSEITPVREVDGRAVGNATRGPITKQLLTALHGTVSGDGSHREWSYPLKG